MDHPPADVVVGIILNKRNQVLLGEVRQEKQDTDFNGIAYVFPGGKVEYPEGREATIAREVFEETNLKVLAVIFISSRVHPVTSSQIYYYHCIVEDDLQASIRDSQQDIRKFLWVEIPSIKKLMPTLSPEVETYLQKFDQ